MEKLLKVYDKCELEKDISDFSQIQILVNFIENNEPIDTNDSIIMTYYALYYQKMKDYENAKKYYLKAIELKNTSAMYKYGFFLYDIEKNTEEGLKYFKMSADLGDSNGYVYLGIHTKEEDGLKKYSKIAAKMGNPKGMINLGTYYSEIKNRKDKMVKYYLAAAKLGNRIAMHQLGRYYEKLGNYSQMKKWYLKAIELGDSSAMVGYGQFLELIEKKYEEMKKYYKMSIPFGEMGALIRLAQYYRNIENNYQETEKLLKEGVEIYKCSEAMIFLGDYYRDITNDYLEMQKYYLMAISNGETKGYTRLGNFYRDIDVKEMKKYYLLGMQNNEEEATYAFGTYYLSVPNIPMAKKCLQKAITLDCHPAFMTLGVFYSNIEKNSNNMTKLFSILIDNVSQNLPEYDIIKKICSYKKTTNLCLKCNENKEVCIICPSSHYICENCLAQIYFEKKELECPTCNEKI